MVCPDIRSKKYDLDAQSRLAEAEGLALAIGLVTAHSSVIPIRTVRPNTLFGVGQVEAIKTACALHEAELVVVDGALSAIQQRNLEETLKRKVIDRTGLILEIFGERAATAEGRLQVELAHLDYQQSRLVRSWTHLERQRGGFGFLGGPGETQIEADRRMIRQRMGRLRRELEQVRKTRKLHRARRGRAPWPVIALVGYTNAGKSTLFNRLTGAEVMAEDLLFATLDPTMRAISLPGVEKAILSDTVGFISDLPTQLVAAFRATLEEVTSADIICHVRDMSSDAAASQKREVMQILADLGVIAGEDEELPASELGEGGKLTDPDANSGHIIPIVEVWNKCDALGEQAAAELKEAAIAQPMTVCMSALTGDGAQLLEEKLSDLLTKQAATLDLIVPAGDGRKLAWLYAHGDVLEDLEADLDGRGDAAEPLRQIKVRLNPKEMGQFAQL